MALRPRASFESYAARFPDARRTARFEDLLEDEELTAVAIATPVVTHFELACSSRYCSPATSVEKPPALFSSDASASFVALSRRNGGLALCCLTLFYHPGSRS